MEDTREYEDIIIDEKEEKDKMLSVRIFQLVLCIILTVGVFLMCKFSDEIKDYFVSSMTFFDSFSISDEQITDSIKKVKENLIYQEYDAETEKNEN